MKLCSIPRKQSASLQIFTRQGDPQASPYLPISCRAFPGKGPMSSWLHVGILKFYYFIWYFPFLRLSLKFEAQRRYSKMDIFSSRDVKPDLPDSSQVKSHPFLCISRMGEREITETTPFYSIFAALLSTFGRLGRIYVHGVPREIEVTE